MKCLNILFDCGLENNKRKGLGRKEEMESGPEKRNS
jgi:hypothetical protein